FVEAGRFYAGGAAGWWRCHRLPQDRRPRRPRAVATPAGEPARRARLAHRLGASSEANASRSSSCEGCHRPSGPPLSVNAGETRAYTNCPLGPVPLGPCTLGPCTLGPCKLSPRAVGGTA